MEKLINNLLLILFVAVVTCGSLYILDENNNTENENISYVEVPKSNNDQLTTHNEKINEDNNNLLKQPENNNVITDEKIVISDNNQSNNQNENLNTNNIPSSKNTNTPNSNNLNNNKTNQNTLDQNNNEKIENKKITEDTNEENLEVEEIYTSKDLKVIDSLNTLKSDLDELLAEDNRENLKNQAKLVFITFVDFIFYDGNINGVTFDEMSEAGKQKVLEIANKVDVAIEKVFPNYKETISSTASKAFNKASELIAEGAKNIDNFAKEKLDPTLYQDIIDAKDDLVKYTKNAFSILGDVGSGLFKEAKNWFNNWWQDFKNK